MVLFYCLSVPLSTPFKGVYMPYPVSWGQFLPPYSSYPQGPCCCASCQESRDSLRAVLPEEGLVVLSVKQEANCATSSSRVISIFTDPEFVLLANRVDKIGRQIGQKTPSQDKIYKTMREHLISTAEVQYGPAYARMLQGRVNMKEKDRDPQKIAEAIRKMKSHGTRKRFYQSHAIYSVAVSSGCIDFRTFGTRMRTLIEEMKGVFRSEEIRGVLQKAQEVNDTATYCDLNNDVIQKLYEEVLTAAALK